MTPPSVELERAELSFAQRLEKIRRAKEEQTAEKQQVMGAMDYDDHALILPPPEHRQLVQSISGSGMPITDVLIKGIPIEATHPDGAFYGARATGHNFRSVLEHHPPYIDPMSSLAGGYMVNFYSYRKGGWKPELDFSHLLPVRQKYQLIGAIGASQHFCQDLAIGLQLGWRGIQAKIERGRLLNPGSAELYDGLEDVTRGIQAWISTNAAEARRLAAIEEDPVLADNLGKMAWINERLVDEAPRTFREACQWMLWYNMAARMYNGSGSLGRLDVLLLPFYQLERSAGTLTDEEATFHLACFLARDTAYLQLGGPDEQGRDLTNPVSFLVLEAAHQLKIPANVGICVGDHTDPRLLRRGVEILLEDRLGIPKFLGIDRTVEDFAKNGYPLEVSRQRAYSGCHWSAIPGREYTMNDCVKINFAKVFDVALRELMDDPLTPKSMEELWRCFETHLRCAVEGTAASIDFNLKHIHEVFPELVLDLLCHGPIEKGVDASDAFRGGVEYYNLCIDGCALATVADSFAALEQRVVHEKRLNWDQLLRLLDSDWAGPEGERARLMMKNIRRYGYGSALADEYAGRIAALFTRLVKEKPTPAGFNLVPGLFSWANTIPMGKELGATPNGRHRGDPISHGANPDPGFRADGAPSAMALAIAGVQCGYGNTAPMQLELDPGLSASGEDVEQVASLIRTHFALGGTQINLNILDKEKVLAAHADPCKHPDLIVRVTGFSAYFASLSKEFRQLVVDRLIAEN